ncbi:MAG: PPK2 family polyphosphate kinase [Gemmatimonadaceae bacterium]
MKLKPVTADRPPKLRDEDAAAPHGAPAGDKLEKALEKQADRLKQLQQLFYADGRYALLVVLQGRDASGKDGVIKKVIGAVNPMGVELSSFKVPSDEERAHDFLWRIHARVPARGTIGVFNRSHYEDVLVVRVHGLVPKKVWSKRFDQINAFERMLSLNNVVILKFMLHVSRDEQKKRLEDRLADRTKNWKFRAGDLEDRAKWDEFTRAYRDALTRCSTPWAPWYVVPADDNDVRNLLVARTIADTLDSLELRYPKPEKGARDLRIE